MERSELQEAFIKIIHKFMKTNMNELFVDMTREEFFMLEMIGRHTEGETNHKGINVSELAKQLGVSSPAVSRMLKYLESKQLIYRMAGETDRRNTCVFLTTEGNQARIGAMKMFREFSDKIITYMGMEEMSTLLTLWNKLADVLEMELNKIKS